ncbi:hypothetical protein FALBO_10573 [Fusarium albosuccineum]|uniref:Uncharacterized protein n=1 Tax=Fusarium albosuccineum TaxID=1237068 RepID=A0A8H4L6P7_9HYPO|nr:hypothetical protein FALBO_10573 [Fusarium albosuccineum]
MAIPPLPAAGIPSTRREQTPQRRPGLVIIIIGRLLDDVSVPWLEAMVTVIDDAPPPVVPILDGCVVLSSPVLVVKVTDRAVDGMLVADELKEGVALLFSSVLVPSVDPFSVVRVDEERVVVTALLEAADISEDVLAAASVEPCDFFVGSVSEEAAVDCAAVDRDPVMA